MKNLKKLMALVIAVVMMIGMTIPAMAASITLKQGDTHEYKVFQVLTGTLAEAGSKQLGNPAWGADATDAAKETDVNAFITEITAAGLSEAEIAAKVAAKVDTTKAGRGTVKDGQPLTGLDTGYYVLVDVKDLDTDQDGKTLETKSLHIVQVLNDVTMVEIKYGTTEQDKEIVSDTLGNGTDPNAIGGDVDNVSIGDTVNFKISATIPENADLYNYFYFVINDTLDPGLTLNADSIEVYKEAISDGNKLTYQSDFGTNHTDIINKTHTGNDGQTD